MTPTPEQAAIIESNQLKELRDRWYAEAREQSVASIAAFAEKLAAYDHDYNTICYACGAAAIAAASAIDKSPRGGITGFQASAIMWEFVTEWLHEQNKPLRLVRYEHLLYPQYERHFDKTISQDTADWLRERAGKLLAEREELAHPDVIAHWQNIANGALPFGFIINE